MKSIFILFIALLLLKQAGGQGFSKAEYFFDTDPGINNGISVLLTGAVDTLSFITPVSTAALPAGFHFLGLRIKHNDAVWGLFEKRGFYISSTSSDAANITAAEYFFDTDPGAGNGIAATVGATGPGVNFTVAIPATLSAGFHFLSIRTKGADAVWGLFEKRGFYISSTLSDAANITAAEYFFDTDPGAGNGIAATVGATGPVVNFTAAIPATLSAGFHFLSIRTKGADAVWGLFEKRGFYISSTSSDAANITAAEYFFDTDPGAGNGIAATVGATGPVVNFTAAIPATLSAGFHFLSIRTKGADAVWGLFEKRGFYISQATGNMPIITNAEYFFDADPGVGNGIPLLLNTPANTVTQVFNIPVPASLLPGQHFLSVRAKDQADNWGLYEFSPLTISGTVPVTGLSLTAKKDGNNVTLNWFTLTETNTADYEIERSANGILFEKIGVKPAVGNSTQRTNYLYTDALPKPSLNYYRLKQIDIDGRYIYSAIKLVNFGREKHFTVYPVVSSSKIWISGITETSVIKIFNTNGQLIKSVKTGMPVSEIDITTLAAGMYYLVIEINGKLLFNQKIIKR